MSGPPTSSRRDARRIDRARSLRAHYQVVIIGGGINGAGTFRDLSLQGVDCLLIDKGDFCAGTSAAPSRLIHGGIKYLETGQFALVRESTLERNLLLQNAPHLVKPIETVLPLRSWLGGIVPTLLRFLGREAKLADRGALVVKIGLELFDWFGRRHRVMPRHRLHTGGYVRQTFPGMAKGIVALATYFDAKVTLAERLGLDLVLDGIAANPGSTALNYVSVAKTENGKMVLADHATGAQHDVTADVIVNAAGSSIDLVNDRLQIPSQYIGGQKGSHVIVANDALRAALGTKMIYFGASDGRVALMYPFLGNVLVGATDIPVAATEAPRCTDDETDYMLRLVGEIFPEIAVTRDHVIYSYAGIRPLPRSDAKDPGAVSRGHSIRTDQLAGGSTPVLSLIGGKWTTFRGFAEEVTDSVLDHLRLKRVRHTRLLPIGGGRDFPQPGPETAAFIARLCRTGLDEERAARLLDRFGTRAIEVAEWCGARQDRPLASLPDYGTAEIGFIAAREAVTHLSDIVFRRTDIALSGRLGSATVMEVGELAGAELGWDKTRLAAEAADVAHIAITYHSVKPDRFVRTT